ncbi:MAG: OmpH family outer membrane protein [Candidatus Omnitrophica bacterium]|nr:OmpH family outer membrane protein [Candidatus Omnitrophota bacterium]
MMKTFLLKSVVFSLACLVLASPAMAQAKFGTVNLRKVFDNYYKTKQADTQLKERAADFDKQRKEFIDSYQKANEEYKKLLDSTSDQAVSAEERDRRKNSAEAKLRDIKEIEGQINQFDRSARTTLDEQKRRMREQILRQIQEVVTEKAKAAGMTMVWDTASESINNTPILMYTNGENDISDAVLKKLNEGAPADFVKSNADTSITGGAATGFDTAPVKTK